MATPRETTQHPHGVAGTAAPKWDQLPTHDLLQAINSGQIDPGALTGQQRRACVEVIRASGRSVSEIAKFLKTSDGTIKRHLRELRKAHAEALTPQYINEQRGVNQQRLDQAIQELIALARAKDTPPRVKANALAMVATFSHAQLRDLNAIELERLRNGTAADAEHAPESVPHASLDETQHEIDRLRVVQSKLKRPDVSNVRAETGPDEEAA